MGKDEVAEGDYRIYFTYIYIFESLENHTFS